MNDHNIAEWGLAVNVDDRWQSWEITHIEDGKQGAQLGIKVGSKLKSVNNQLINDKNYMDIKDRLYRGAKSKVTFALPVTVYYNF